MEDSILDIVDLSVEFSTYGGIVQAVRGISFSVPRGKTLAIVGESGCGKSVTVQSIMGLIPMPPGKIDTDKNKRDTQAPSSDRCQRFSIEYVQLKVPAAQSRDTYDTD